MGPGPRGFIGMLQGFVALGRQRILVPENLGGFRN